jgi:predicted amidophosphoribosyltransferase
MTAPHIKGRIPPRMVMCPKCSQHLYPETEICPHCGSDTARAQREYEEKARRLEEALQRANALLERIQNS